jgi:hypothetical protein
VAQLRPMLLGETPQGQRDAERSKPRSAPTGPPPTRKLTTPSRPAAGRSLAIAAAVVAVLGGSYGAFEYMRWQPATPGTADAEVKRVAEAEARRKAAADTGQRQADVDAERRRQDEATMSAQRQASLDMERQRREAADAAQRQADTDAEQLRRDEMERVSAEEAARREAAAEEERRRADDRLRIAAATLNAEDRATFVKRVQTVLRLSRCYDGAINGRAGDGQEEADLFVSTVAKKGRSRPTKIELAKATASDFEAWLRDADEVTGDVCVPKSKQPKQEVAKPPRQETAKPPRQEPSRQARQREEAPRARPERREAREPSSSGGGGSKGVCFGGGRNEIVACK